MGDELAGFWRPKDPGGADGDDTTRGHVPDGITREAYSWGGLARMTPAGAVGLGGKLMAGLITAGWTLLLPFGLANVAYWTRRVDERGLPGARDDRRHPRTEAGASVVRLFGLLLTAFLVITFCDLSMDLVATQCFSEQKNAVDQAKAISGTKKPAVLVCGNLPGFLNGLASLHLAPRLAVLSVVPIALLLGLWFVSSKSRARYERSGEAKPPDSKSSARAARSLPVLARKGMWSGDIMVGGLTQLHLAAGFALIAVCLMWPALFGQGNACSKPEDLWKSNDCHHQVGVMGKLWFVDAAVVYGASLLLSIVVLFFCVLMVIRRAPDAPDITSRGEKRARGILLSFALFDVLSAELLMLVARPELQVKVNLLGVSAAPTILLVIMLGLVAWALFLRLSRLGAIWALLLVASVGSVMVEEWKPWSTVAVGLVVAGIVIHLGLLRDGCRRRWQGWAGMGPGMFLGMALWVQVFLSSALVLCVGDWLNGSNGASTLIRKQAADTSQKTPKLDQCGNLCPGQDHLLTAPLPYVLLGAAALLAAIIGVVGVGIAWLRSRPDPNEASRRIRERVEAARRFARVAHRAEKLFGLVSVTGVLLVLGVAMVSTGGWLHVELSPSKDLSSWLRPLDLSTPAIALLGVAGLAALVKGTSTGKKRPLGLLWDLVAFLPRAAHPFAPPCYAERAVPELTDRVDEWLKSNHGEWFVGNQRRGGDRVVISAHSLGGVLTVAALMREQLQAHEEKGAIRLLTYGSQLRAYFARIFPELLGPALLGVPPSLAGRFWAHDPWQDERTSVGEVPDSELKTPISLRSTIVRRLSDEKGGSLWRSLWRPTDYLGFPVWSFRSKGNRLDHPAEEVDDSGYVLAVLTHSNYPRTPAYTTALKDLAGPLEPAPSNPDAPRGEERRPWWSIFPWWR